jgi:hypothetical protein
MNMTGEPQLPGQGRKSQSRQERLGSMGGIVKAYCYIHDEQHTYRQCKAIFKTANIPFPTTPRGIGEVPYVRKIRVL